MASVHSSSSAMILRMRRTPVFLDFGTAGAGMVEEVLGSWGPSLGPGPAAEGWLCGEDDVWLGADGVAGAEESCMLGAGDVGSGSPLVTLRQEATQTGRPLMRGALEQEERGRGVTLEALSSTEWCLRVYLWS
jgi:hypothetical protein